MKRMLCLISAVVLTAFLCLSSSAFTVQDTSSYTGVDASGAYWITFSGNHADITRYSDIIQTAGADVYYGISAVCAFKDKTALLCDDSDHNQLVVYIYDIRSGMLDNFAVNGIKLKNNTDFCCDDSTLYIENYRNSKELFAYSFDGALRGTYRFSDEIKALISGYGGGVYAVCSDTLYFLSGNSFIPIVGSGVEPPLYFASENVLLSVYGKAYIINENRITNVFDVVTDYMSACACVIGNRLYCSRGTMIYGYDIPSGETVCYYDCREKIDLLYADGSKAVAVHPNNITEIRRDDFFDIEKPNTSPGSSQASPQNGNSHERGTITSAAYRVDLNKYQISGIAPETTVSAFKANMRYDGYSLSIYRDSAEKKSGNVGTAMTAVFTSDSGSITFELAVTGDLTGEGNRNTRDLTILMDYLLGAADFNGVYEIAADLSGDGKIDVIDLAMMKRSI